MGNYKALGSIGFDIVQWLQDVGRSLRLKAAQKPYIVLFLGPKALKHESLEIAGLVCGCCRVYDLRVGMFAGSGSY